MIRNQVEERRKKKIWNRKQGRRIMAQPGMGAGKNLTGIIRELK